MPSGGSALALASSLRALDDERLATLIRTREVREHGVGDWFDLAERLLERSSVQHAVARLDRRALLALVGLCTLVTPGTALPLAEVERYVDERTAETDDGFPLTVEARVDRLVGLGFAARTDAGDVLTFDAVCEVVTDPKGLGLRDADTLGAPPPPQLDAGGRPSQQRVDAAAAEQAFAIATTVVELFDELAGDPPRELARGGVGAPDLRRIAVATGTPVDQVPTLLGIVRRAGFIELSGGRWRPTDAASAWVLRPVAERWVALATAWAAQISEDARFFLGDRIPESWGPHLIEYLRWFYPAADERFRDEIDGYVRSAELLALLALHTPTTPGIAAIARRPDDALASISALLPAEVDRVYLQNDLTVIAAGPLETAVHERLRGIARLETRGIASTYRISDDSLTAALDHGETAESILAFLETISLTGVPQPARFLLAEAAGRYGLVRTGAVVTAPSATRVGYVRSTEPVTLETILVDRRLTALGLRRDGDGAVSRFDRDVLYTALRDARYPVAVENADGEVQPPPRRPTARVLAPQTIPADVDHASTLVARLRAAGTPADDATAWLERQLELAVKSRLRVAVTLRTPEGGIEEHVLEPTAVARGRLRALDRRAGIERTLPVSRIVGLREVDGR
ncbi:helicase-associated domain-containing protein [Galbitalea sp. SE-J8]|uniref:helicase-associated domain-containing protein n=1 Tax=Galbitalea sp. SE-J8 TaxID=3054952 RepID=UPI00259CDCAC|nr:helicase-associated domain-containing protein [Galbitalea sp. SE-J8]MDM4763733.1 helicase-associated domain-containing protein [Galbitalea sp. SE-J8]